MDNKKETVTIETLVAPRRPHAEKQTETGPHTRGFIYLLRQKDGKDDSRVFYTHDGD